MAYGTRVRFEELREAAFGAIAAGYTAVGGATSDHTRLFSIFNSEASSLNKVFFPKGNENFSPKIPLLITLISVDSPATSKIK